MLSVMHIEKVLLQPDTHSLDWRTRGSGIVHTFMWSAISQYGMEPVFCKARGHARECQGSLQQ